jgi:hypothetical protein
MARYTSLFKIAAHAESVQPAVATILESCNMRVIHEDSDYLVAREVPGQVSFPKLVTVEVLIDKPRETPNNKLSLSCVIKNEELPLQSDNHCRRVFELVNDALISSSSWQLLEHITS